jgi:hypothetical protein
MKSVVAGECTSKGGAARAIGSNVGVSHKVRGWSGVSGHWSYAVNTHVNQSWTSSNVRSQISLCTWSQVYRYDSEEMGRGCDGVQ